MAVTIGVDVGGTKVAAAVVADDGTVLARRRIPTEADDPVAVVAGITKVATEMKATAPGARALGIGAAGLIDSANGVVVGAPNIAWQNVHLRSMLEERVKLPVVVDNDANVAAFGEAIHGAGRGHPDQVMLTIGTGVGGGIIVDGRIYRGGGGIGAELGHMVVQADGGARCPCGNHGCLEAMASGTAIGRMGRERARDADAEPVVRTAGDAGSITGKIVGEAAVAGDPWARAIVREAGAWLGVGLANIVNIFDPTIVVVGGGAAAGIGELLLEPARARMNELMLGREWRKPPPVVLAALGDDAGVIGAAALARAL